MAIWVGSERESHLRVRWTFGVSLGVTDYTDSVDNHRETVVLGTV